MKTKLLFLTKMSLKKKMINKWFLFANIFIGLAVISVMNIDSIINYFGGNFNEPTKILVLDDTDKAYSIFKSTFNETNQYLENVKPATVSQFNKSYKQALKDVKQDKSVLIYLTPDQTNTLKAEVIANNSIDELLYQSIVTSINNTKYALALSNSNISPQELAIIYNPVSIEKVYLDKDSNEDANELLMGAIFPILILPFFMLSIYLVQMIGAEINDEKTTRSMEIIIGNVSPQVHFFSKVLAGNIFVLLQGLLLLIFSGLGLIIRTLTGGSNIIDAMGTEATDIWKTLVDAGFVDQLIIIIPVTLILMILSFLAYSLLAGVLASMTTSIEDYQQLQMPIIIISLVGYYLALMSTMFSGSIFIRVMSYVPFISALLAPALLVLGEITLYDIVISIALLIGLNYLLIKYGIKIYKVGILNYSSTKLWTKMFKAVKNENVV